MMGFWPLGFPAECELVLRYSKTTVNENVTRANTANRRKVQRAMTLVTEEPLTIHVYNYMYLELPLHLEHLRISRDTLKQIQTTR